MRMSLASGFSPASMCGPLDTRRSGMVEEGGDYVWALDTLRSGTAEEGGEDVWGPLDTRSH